jgi:prepilin-type N-terminal cleavage/methylation domain-containing protein
MRTRKGFSLAELMVALTLSGIVISGAYGLMRTQSRAYGKQLGTGDAAETLEGAGALLSWEIRHADMATDTLVSLSADTLSVRSVQGVGIICAKKDPGLYAIWKNGGDIQPTVDDTAMVSMLGNQAWTKAKITAVGTPVAMGLTACAWTGGRSPDLVVQLTVNPADSAKLIVGGMFRSFRRTQFAEFQDAGRWWLGRKVGNAAWGKITGPLLSPTTGGGGLKFVYYDSTGAVTTGASKAQAVSVTLRSQSYRQYIDPVSHAPTFRGDSLQTVVYVRR